MAHPPRGMTTVGIVIEIEPMTQADQVEWADILAGYETFLAENPDCKGAVVTFQACPVTCEYCGQPAEYLMADPTTGMEHLVCDRCFDLSAGEPGLSP